MEDKPKIIELGKKDAMQAALEAAKRSLPMMIEMAVIAAKVRKANYDALIAEGFDEAQALDLCKYTTL